MRRAARIDTTARSLIALAASYGWQYLPLNGIVDGLLCEPWSGRVLIVDWKTPKEMRGKAWKPTASQQKLVNAAWPIHFVATPDELRALLGMR